jgi:hypothetical protein
MRWLAALLFATPLVAAPCSGFQDAGQILELG